MIALCACTKPAEEPGNPASDEFMSITVQEIGDNFATVVFVPENDDELYTFGIMTKEEYESNFIPSDISADDGEICRHSAYSHTFEELMPETEYVVYAYAVNQEGKYVEGRLESEELTTLEQPDEPVDPTFGITVDSITPGKVSVHIDAKTYSGTYFYGCIAKSEYESCGDDNKVFDLIIGRILAMNAHMIENGMSESDIMGILLKSGNLDMTVSYLRPDTEYVVCVFGCNIEQALLTEVSTASFRTPAQDMVEDASFSFVNVNVTETATTLAKVQYTVKADNGYDGLFFVCSLDKSVYDLNSRIYTGETLPIEEYCWYDYFDMYNWYLTMVDVSWIFENAFFTGEVSMEEDKTRKEEDSIMYIYALAVDGEYGMPRQSRVSVYEAVIPGYADEL